MTTAAATNRVESTAHSDTKAYGGIAVNPAIPVASMEPWRREAIQKVIRLGDLQPNWDSYGSKAPAWGVRQRAIDFLLKVPSDVAAAPAIVPVSGGGYHFEWSVGSRELEVSIDADCRIETLRVQNGMPLEDQRQQELSALFGWLASE